MILGSGITNLVTRSLLVVYGYRSYQAIETETWKDDAHWLTFWLLFSIIQFLEFFIDYFFEEFPFYNEAKLALFVYLGLMKGATVIYEAVGKRAIQMTEAQVEQLSQRKEFQDGMKTLKEQREKIVSQLQKKQ
eukprot:NODE_4238_length_839_cov_54.572152_g3912_i0.p2 GENE.NODE_4238_length_839_cov_54.572152_g3912_i0~~NODE_4238_length_839_cov_54.572152_g3912_i0.p2  ORF type:complete len:133 (-),score=46.81 NODE_4238_length_839_cov_54.572152_g3912_i0:338-736(-)